MPTSQNMMLSFRKSYYLAVSWMAFSFCKIYIYSFSILEGYISKCNKESVDKGNSNKLKQKNRTSRH